MGVEIAASHLKKQTFYGILYRASELDKFFEPTSKVPEGDMWKAVMYMATNLRAV